MKVTVEKIDDINFIISGVVENSVIEAKVAELKKAQSQESAEEESSEEKMQQDAAGQAFREFIEAGVKEAKINPDNLLGQPALKRYEQKESSVFFEVELATSPEVNVDIDYEEVVPSFTKPVADPKAVEEKLEEFAKQQAPFVALETPRAVENGDVAVIDFKGFIDGKAFEGGSAEKFNLKIGSGSFIPGFEEQLIGMNYGDEKTISVTFPKEYQAPDLAGKETQFEIKLHEIQEQRAETPNDEFAKKILSDAGATLETLKAKFADQVTAEEVSKLYMAELKPKIISALLSKIDFTLPSNMVEQEIDAKVSKKSRSFTEEEHKAFAEDKGKFMELRESLRAEARDTVKLMLIVEALAKKEGLEVHEQEVHAALGYQAMMSGHDAQDLLKYYEENNLIASAKMGLLEDKLFGTMLGFHKGQ
ncbi:MAG: trigger factor [Campylobacterales bacterium]|nr:trigger factor [Campylobacterales bacterium]